MAHPRWLRQAAGDLSKEVGPNADKLNAKVMEAADKVSKNAVGYASNLEDELRFQAKDAQENAGELGDVVRAAPQIVMHPLWQAFRAGPSGWRDMRIGLQRVQPAVVRAAPRGSQGSRVRAAASASLCASACQLRHAPMHSWTRRLSAERVTLAHILAVCFLGARPSTLGGNWFGLHSAQADELKGHSCGTGQGRCSSDIFVP